MKKLSILFLILGFVGTVQASPALTPTMSMGIDLSQPYIIAINGNGVNKRNNINMGVDYRYFTSDALNFGLRYAVDMEKRNGSPRTMSIAPGVQVQWFQGRTWMPYFRADAPIILHGASNASLDSSQKDAGIAVGSGIAWNLGDQIGIQHLVFRYDFTISYLFGFGSALTSLGLEFFKIGVDYRF